MYNPFTETEVETLRGLVALGKDTRFISQFMNRAEDTIHKRCKRHGLTLTHVNNSQWNDTTDAVVREGYREGISARDIAKSLGTTKKAVIGRANRLGLSHPSRVAGYKTPEARRAKQRLVYNIERGKSLAETPAQNRCQYIFGDVPNHTWCGELAIDGSSYCHDHHIICYRHEDKALQAVGRRY